MCIRNKKFKTVSLGLILLLILLSTTSCTYLKGKDSVTPFGAEPLIDELAFEKIDLARQLYPTGEGLIEGAENAAGIQANKKNLRLAFDEFYDKGNNIIQRRNRLQERILAASNQRCGEYLKYIKSLDARTNFLMGSLTTILAGAGAIFTAADTVRALAGSAAITSGIRSEFNEDYFANQTIQVISNGIRARRKAVYVEIVKQRRDGLTSYPVERAIKDAIEYHNGCTLVAGLEQAALSIDRVENPGLRGAQKALVQAKHLQRIMEADPKDISSIALLDPLGLKPSHFFEMDMVSDSAFISLTGSATTALQQLGLLTKSFTKNIQKLKGLKEFSGKEIQLDDLEKLMRKQAAPQVKNVILTQIQKRAQSQDTKIGVLQVEIAEAEADQREIKTIELGQQISNGRVILGEVLKIRRILESKLSGAEDFLEDKDEKNINQRIGNATNKIEGIILSMVEKRADKARALTEALDVKGDPLKALTNAINAETIPGVSISSKADILKELKGIKTVDSLEPFITAFRNGIKEDI